MRTFWRDRIGYIHIVIYIVIKVACEKHHPAARYASARIFHVNPSAYLARLEESV